MDLNELAREIHEQNVAAGWWDEWPNKVDRVPTARMLVVTELAEAAEGVRKDLMDDHLPHHKMFHVELADAAIRLLDLAGALRVDLDGMEIRKHGWGAFDRATNDLERLDHIVKWMGYDQIQHGCDAYIRYTLCRIMTLAEFHGIDLLSIIDEKRAYNAERADHKRENRAKAGGKRW